MIRRTPVKNNTRYQALSQSDPQLDSHSFSQSKTKSNKRNSDKISPLEYKTAKRRDGSSGVVSDNLGFAEEIYVDAVDEDDRLNRHFDRFQKEFHKELQHQFSEQANSVIPKAIETALESFLELHIAPLKKELENLKSENSNLKDEICWLTDENAAIKNDIDLRLDEQEQYSRRDCLIFRNMSVETDRTNEVNKKTDEMCLDLCNDKLGIPVRETDISRSHVIGKIRNQTSLASGANSKTDSKKFNPGNFVKRPVTADPYSLTARYRLAGGPVRRVKSGVITRRKRRSNSGHESDIASSGSLTSRNFNFFDGDDIPDDFDYDAEDEVFDGQMSRTGNHSQCMYLRMCKEMKITPSTYLCKHLAGEKLVMKHHMLSEKGTKACCFALLANPTIQKLDLEDNGIGPGGAPYVADLLRENTFITELTLSENNIGPEGTKIILNVIKDVDVIRKLDLSANNFQESDADMFRDFIEECNSIRELYLHHNSFREVGGIIFGDAIRWNDTLQVLDLSWNHLRRKGAIGIAEGLMINEGLKVLNISWNGFYLDGSKNLAKALEKNTTLEELDISCNRINKECLKYFMQGLKKNTTLKTLGIADNPLTSVGACTILKLLDENPSIGLTNINLGVVELDFLQLLEKLHDTRNNFHVKYGDVIGQDIHSEDKDERELVDENPVLILMEMGKILGFRLMDLFASMDKDGSKSLTKDEIKTGLMEVNIPLSERSLDRMIEKLDIDGDGEIDFSELLSGQMEHRKKLTKMLYQRDHGVDIEDTEVGRIRQKLVILMRKKTKDNPALNAVMKRMGIKPNAAPSMHRRESKVPSKSVSIELSPVVPDNNPVDQTSLEEINETAELKLPKLRRGSLLKGLR